jgi:hypothetical protein
MDMQPHVSSSLCSAVPMPCRTSTCIAVIVAALAAAAAPAPAQQDTGGGRGVPAGGQAAVSGTVTDATTGAPIRAARIRIPDARVDVLTDAAGRFTASGVAPGSHAALVTALGYGERAEIWEVGAGGLSREVRMAPDPVVLQGLTVRANRLERRLRASGMSALAFNRNLLIASADRDAAKFIREMGHITPVHCGALNSGGAPRRLGVAPAASEPNCIRVRGTAIPACILIDDTPSSFGELAMYRPGDLYRMEVVGGGRAILAYTTFFAENIARTGYVPPAIDTQISMYCSKGPTLN